MFLLAGLANEMWISEVVSPSVSTVEKFLKRPFQETHLPFNKQEPKIVKHDDAQSRKRFICEV